jgi:hypothetical protein
MKRALIVVLMVVQLGSCVVDFQACCVGSSKSAPEYQPPTQKNLAAFAFSGTTRDSMDKRRGQADSERSKQVGITFTEVLIVVESGGSGGGLWGGGSKSRNYSKIGADFPCTATTGALWTNGVDGRIQRAKPVSNSLSTKV